MTSSEGGECVGETMQSEMGVANPYTLSVAWKGSTADVTVRSTSGDYACTFPARVEGDGFTTFGVPGFLSCEPGSMGIVRDFVCANGLHRDMLRFGENISGHISGREITGEWDVSWIIGEAGRPGDDLATWETKAEYTGSR